MAVDKNEFRAALGRFASGVTVVTTLDAERRPQGLTVSAFSSVSLDPPLVLVCIEKGTRTHDALSRSGVFVVNLLAEDQEEVSRRFASRAADKFAGLDYAEGAVGAPVLPGVLGNVECRVRQTCDGGDHTIFVGEVEATNVSEGSPLIYFRGGYAGLGSSQ